MLLQGNVDQLSPQTSSKVEIDAHKHEYVAEYSKKEQDHMENLILAGGHVRSRGPCGPRRFNCVCVSEEKLFYHDTNRNLDCFCRQAATQHWYKRHANLALLSLDRAATVQTYHPIQNWFDFSVSFC